MDESALEQYFDLFIMNDSKMEGEESEEPGDMPPPDELLTENEDGTTGNESSTNLDYSSQNATAAAELPGGTSVPVTPVTPVHKQPEITPRIHNVMATVRLGYSLDLHFIARNAWNVEYNPKVINALIMRLRRPKTTAMIYRSGNMVCTGAKSEDKSRLAARKFARILQKLGFPVRFLDFKIRNIVASCSTFLVCLEDLAQLQACSYEPELFPGLFYSGVAGITMTIFASGNISLTGATKEAELYEAFDNACRIMRRFEREGRETTSDRSVEK